MPRPKPNRASLSFMVRGQKLSIETEAKLIELLGLTKTDPLTTTMRRQYPGARVIERKPGGPITFVLVPETNSSTQEQVEKAVLTEAGKLLRQIEIALDTAVTGSKHLDKPPRPADYVAAFKRAGRDAVKLHNHLADWKDYFRNQVTTRGYDINAIEAALASLVDVSSAVLKDFGRRSSKGARKNTALYDCIKQLREIFRTHYRGPQTGRRRHGAFQQLGEEEARELEFVKIALWDARVLRPDRNKLQRLFRDSRCAADPG